MTTMYAFSVPTIKRFLNNTSVILKKAAEYADEKKIDHQALITARLFPDMYPLSRQIQIATDMSKNGIARLAGVEIPKFEDSETTFDELQARIAKTIAFLDTITPEQMVGSEAKEITLVLSTRTLNFNGLDYLNNWVLPNFYFHITTAYDILRHNGLTIGKPDFLGG